jgi:hypothetical protein
MCCKSRFRRLGMQTSGPQQTSTPKWFSQTAEVWRFCVQYEMHQGSITISIIVFAVRHRIIRITLRKNSRHREIQDLLINCRPIVHFQQSWVRFFKKASWVVLEEHTNNRVQERFLFFGKRAVGMRIQRSIVEMTNNFQIVS